MSLRQEDAWERQGAEAALAGESSCPYDRATETKAWNFWTYGNSVAKSEMAIIMGGEVFFSSTARMNPKKPGTGIPVKDAIQSGLWTPKWAKYDAT